MRTWLRETWQAADRQRIATVFSLTAVMTATTAATQSWVLAASVFVSSTAAGGAVLVLAARSRIQHQGNHNR